MTANEARRTPVEVKASHARRVLGTAAPSRGDAAYAVACKRFRACVKVFNVYRDEVIAHVS